MKRRHFLIASGLISASAYINHRSLRYPRLSFEPEELTKQYNSEGSQLDLSDFIAIKGSSTNDIHLRAIAPQPQITLNSLADTTGSVVIQASNLSPRAMLQVEADPKVNIHEAVDGIHRTIEISNLTKNNPVELIWRLPDQQIRFAAIGDSGGGTELDWCLQRSAQLDADFVLHLGDFNYGEGEYDRAIEQFNQSPIPVYVTIGNHDFNDSGLVYQQFLDQIGPQNHSFTIANTRFTNLDTAVNFFPAYSGNRGRMMRQIKSSSEQVNDHVVFTHKPFVDSREGQDHDISGVGEKSWLRNAMQDIGAKDLLCGHVHHSSERDYEGIHQWMAGEGLGHEDLVHKKLVCKVLIGEIVAGQDVVYEWQDLNMPWALHQSHTHEKKLKAYNHIEQLDWYLNLINTT